MMLATMLAGSSLSTPLINGLIALGFGIYTSLLGYAIVPSNPGNPQKSAKWRARFGSAAQIGGPLLTLVGLFLVVRAYF